MTKTELEQLNRTISEMREPLPLTPWECEDCGWYLSAGGNWYQDRSREEQPIVPRDWTGDENASAVLLEEMPLATLAVENLHQKQWGCWPLGLTLTPIAMRSADEDRKVAIALAWKNWKAGKQS